MDKKLINLYELSIILDTQKSTMYYITHPEKKKAVALKKAEKENRILKEDNIHTEKLNITKECKEYIIDIDKFLNEHKIYNFKFQNETADKSFLDRMLVKKIININDYPEYISTNLVKEAIDITNYELQKLRQKNLIKYKIIENAKYPVGSSGRNQYLYDKNSIIEYYKNNNIKLTPICKTNYNISKQFYTIKEIQEYLLNKYNTEVSISTIYRRIAQSNEIPAIKLATMIRIPILEFNKLNLDNIFKI